MVQTEWDKRAFQYTVYPRSRIAGIENQPPELWNTELYKRPQVEHCNTDDKINHRTNNRYKSCSSEKWKHLRKLGLVKFVVKRGNSQTNYDASENTHLQGSYSECRSGWVFRHCLNAAFCHDEDAYSCIHYQIRYSSRKSRYLFFFFGHAYCNAHCKQQRKVVKNSASCPAHYVQYRVKYAALVDHSAKVIGLDGCWIRERTAYSKQKSGNRQQRNWKHKRTSYAL